MKKLVKALFGILFFISLSTSILSAQERTNFNIQKTIELDNVSENKQVKIEVNEKECRFNLRIKSLVRAGEVKIEIFDPNGKKQGNFSVGCEADSEGSIEIVNGIIDKLIESPEIGDWLVKISPKKAVGKVTILYEQSVIKRKIPN